ncbi:hypothetical protein [Streptomyces mirabilis]|uniref:hypothetical protein n=1 Tax=Streptomyces mirabilis TaxID=68239 RepID=UPI00366845E6
MASRTAAPGAGMTAEALRDEFCHRQNSLHGKHVLYDADGRLRLEELYESVIFELKSTDPQWKTLNEFRNHFQW